MVLIICMGQTLFCIFVTNYHPKVGQLLLEKTFSLSIIGPLWESLRTSVLGYAENNYVCSPSGAHYFTSVAFYIFKDV